MNNTISTQNKILWPKLCIAQSFSAKAIGLLGRKSMTEDDALLIHSCRSIHTFFMRFSIDLIFVDQSYRVKKMMTNVKPWRIKWCFGAQHVIEIKANTLHKHTLSVGDFLTINQETL